MTNILHVFPTKKVRPTRAVRMSMQLMVSARSLPLYCVIYKKRDVQYLDNLCDVSVAWRRLENTAISAYKCP